MLKRLLARRRPLMRRRRSSKGSGSNDSSSANSSPTAAAPSSSDVLAARDRYEDEVAEDATALTPLPAPGPLPPKPQPSEGADATAPATVESLPSPSPERAAPAPAPVPPSRDATEGSAAAAAASEGDGDLYAKIILGVYMLFLLLGFGLSLLSDVVRVMLPRLLQLSLGLQAGATAFFCLVVPLTHLSGGLFFRKQWRFFQPFRGGIRFILFQALSWSFYALCLALSLGGLLFWSSLAHRAFGLVTSFGVCGVISQVFMVMSLFVYERRSHHHHHHPPPQAPSSSTKPTPTMVITPVAAAVKALKGALYREVFFHHNIALALVAVALAVLAEALWWKGGGGDGEGHFRDFARAAGALSVLLFATVLFSTYGVGGHLFTPKTPTTKTPSPSRTWRFWQPFLGGARFVLLQALSWTLFTLSVLVQLAFVVSTMALGFELFVGAAAVAGAFFLASEVLMIVSLHVYLPGPPPAAAEGKEVVKVEAEAPAEERTERVVEGQGKRKKKCGVALRAVAVDEEGLEHLRRLTVITVLSNMQYLPFLLPVLPFLASGLPPIEAAKHWAAFFCCLTSCVVAHAFAKQTVAKAPHLPHNGWKRAFFLHAPPTIVYCAEAALAFCAWREGGSRAGSVWLALTATHFAYMLLTFRGRPEVTGMRYLGEALELWKGGPSLFALLDGIEGYFDGRLVWTGGKPLEAIKGQPHILAFHPHGVQPFTVFWIQLSRAWRAAMPGKRFCVMTASVTHYVPLMRDLLQWLGGREVSKESILHALSKGESVLLVPGGQQEMIESRSGVGETRVVTRHVGFIRLAVQEGVPLVPVLSLGEVEVMDFVRVPALQRFFIQRIGIPVPFLPYGLFGLPLPRPAPITVLFGRPIPTGPPRPNPTHEEVQAVADAYFASLQALHDEHKHHHPPTAQGEDHRLVLI